MAKLETGPVLVSKYGRRELDLIIAWFEKEARSLYALGRVFLDSEEELEEAFYRSIIRLEEEMHRRKKELSFERKAASVFLHQCQELVDEKSSPSSGGDDQFGTIRQLESPERDAVALTYVKGYSREEAATILRIPVETVTSRVFAGIRVIREKMNQGRRFQGCTDYQPYYLDYLGRTMERPEKVEFEIHIYHCQYCQEDLASFQEVTLTLDRLRREISPSDRFMEKLRSRVDEREASRKKRRKKRNSILMSIAGVFALLISMGFVTGGFASLYYSYTEEDERLRTMLQHNLGERLNLEAESDGVKITIKSVVADDVQTLVFYEIEDMNHDNRYMINPYEGIFIENERDVMTMGAGYGYYSPPVDQSDYGNDQANVYVGTISLSPVVKDKGEIHLNIARVMQLTLDSQGKWVTEGEMKFAEGDWSFKIPFEKQSSRLHEMNREVEVAGIPVRLDKLTIAPTATILHYSFQSESDKQRIEMINFDSIKAGEKKSDSNPFGGHMYVEAWDQEGWTAFTAAFDTLYFQDPKEVDIRFASLRLSVDEPKTIILDAGKDLPQTTDYLGNPITIDKISVGNPAKVVLTHGMSKDRAYESVNYHFKGMSEDDDMISIGVSSGEGVLMDEDGKVYDVNEYVHGEMDLPRYFETVQTIDFYRDGSTEDYIPTQLDILGYSTTTYVDDVIRVSLDEQ
ncbi:DUF4179 domain-containing protein [Bacillus sp. RO3]|nr:DUF4179 domain-containing protein [Bacillus sp. RO3]